MQFIETGGFEFQCPWPHLHCPRYICLIPEIHKNDAGGIKFQCPWSHPWLVKRKLLQHRRCWRYPQRRLLFALY